MVTLDDIYLQYKQLDEVIRTYRRDSDHPELAEALDNILTINEEIYYDLKKLVDNRNS